MQLFIYSCNSCLYTTVIKEQTMTTTLMVPINPLIQLASGELLRSPQAPEPLFSIINQRGDSKTLFPTVLGKKPSGRKPNLGGKSHLGRPRSQCKAGWQSAWDRKFPGQAETDLSWGSEAMQRNCLCRSCRVPRGCICTGFEFPWPQWHLTPKIGC